MPAKRNVGLLKCDACRRHVSCPLHARISASPASRAARDNLAQFTGTPYPPNGGPGTVLVSHGRYPRCVKLGPAAMSAPMSGLPESGQSGVLLDHLVGAGPRAREVSRLITRLNWSAARSVAHPAACLHLG